MPRRKTIPKVEPRGKYDHLKRPIDPSTGRFVSPGKAKADLMRSNSPEGFWAWVDDYDPQVLQKGRYRSWEPTKEQRRAINRILKSGDLGQFLRNIGMLIWPRRHGKSTAMALIVLWLLTTRDNWTCQLWGNTESHSRRVQLQTLKKIISATKKLRTLIPDKDVGRSEIHCKKRGSVIQGMTSNSMAVAFGDRLDCIWVSDFHACPDLEPINAVQAALLDSDNTLMLIDSNVDSFDGHCHALQKESESDPAIYCHHLWYLDAEHYYDKAPAWIDRGKARRLEKTLLEAAFKRDILGQRSDAKNALFTSAEIEGCKQPYKIPVDDVQSIVQGRKYVIGGGLDRARGVLGLQDSTVWTVVMKVASPKHGDPEFYVLNQKTIVPNTSANVKKIILNDHHKYGLSNVCLESYETLDLVPWLNKQNINCESATASSSLQNATFPELARIVTEGRLSFPKDLKKMPDEMATFTYAAMANGNYKFGHASPKYHDDSVYSLNWAIHSLRAEVLNVYVLGNVRCTHKRKTRQHCYILGGSLEMNCSFQCMAHRQIEDMWHSYREQMLDDDIEITNFFKQYVRHEGALITQNI